MNVCERHIKSDDEVIKKIIEETSVGEELLDMLRKSRIRNLFLTSVDIVIDTSASDNGRTNKSRSSERQNEVRDTNDRKSWFAGRLYGIKSGLSKTKNLK